MLRIIIVAMLLVSCNVTNTEIDTVYEEMNDPEISHEDEVDGSEDSPCIIVNGKYLCLDRITIGDTIYN